MADTLSMPEQHGKIMASSGAPLSPRRAAALAYARDGIAVFPCVANGKRPATEHGFKDRTTDEVTINRWFDENPAYNLGVVPEDAGWCVIDIDAKNGGLETWAKLTAEHPTPATRTVLTPGGGKHLYFYGSLPGSSKQLGPGVDTRGRGSYVVVPPSVIDGRSYRDSGGEIADLPAWISDALSAERQAPARAAVAELDLPVNVERARERLRFLVSAGDVAIEGAGGDDRTYRLCAELLNLGLSSETAAAEIIDLWNPHCVPPWDEDEIAEKVGNATRYAQNEPGSYAAGGNTEAMAATATRYAAEHAPAPPEPLLPSRPAHKFKGFLTWGPELLAREFEPPAWVWADRLMAYEPNLYTGEPGIGKTTLAENLAVATAAGAPFLGFATMPMHVALMVAEDTYGPVRDNIRAIAEAFKVDDAQIAGRIHLLSVKSDPHPDGHSLAEITDEGAVRPTPFLKDAVIPFLVSLNSPVLWIIDPLAEFVRFNNLSDIACRALARDFLAPICGLNGGRVTALVNDHPSKASQLAGTHVAGSVQLRAAFSFVATLRKPKSGSGLPGHKELVFDVIKGRYAAESETELHRVGKCPAFFTGTAPALTLRRNVERVYRHVVERLDRDEFCGNSNKFEHGPGEIAHHTRLDERSVSVALNGLTADRWLIWCPRRNGHEKAHYALGPVAPKLSTLDQPSDEPW